MRERKERNGRIEKGEEETEQKAREEGEGGD